MSSEERQPRGGTSRDVTDEERVIVETRLHWITAVILFVCPALFSAVWLLWKEAFGLDSAEISAAIAVALTGVVMAAARAVMIIYARYTATTDRIIFTDIGFDRRPSEIWSTNEILLSQIERVDLIQDAFGFMLGYGHLRILLTTGDLQYFHWISRPIEFREQILNTLEASREAA